MDDDGDDSAGVLVIREVESETSYQFPISYKDFACFISSDQVQTRFIVVHFGNSTAMMEVEEAIIVSEEERSIFQPNDVFARDGKIDCWTASEVQC